MEKINSGITLDTPRKTKMKVIYMTPERFIRQYQATRLHERKIEAAKAKLLRGESKPLTLEYQNRVLQRMDGQHRAIAAMQLNIGRVKVVVKWQ